MRRARGALSGGIEPDGQAIHRRAQPAPSGGPREGAQHGGNHRRSPEPLTGGAGTDPPADQSGDGREKAAANHPAGPARTRRPAGPGRASPARPAHHRTLSPGGAQPGGHLRVHSAPPGPRGRKPEAVFPGRAFTPVQDLEGRSQADQRGGRPGAARRLRGGQTPGHRTNRQPRGQGGARPPAALSPLDRRRCRLGLGRRRRLGLPHPARGCRSADDDSGRAGPERAGAGARNHPCRARTGSDYATSTGPKPDVAG